VPPDPEPVAAGTRDLVRLEATVRGRVQGVGYRYFVVVESRRLGLTGWVANRADGTVRLIAEGEATALDELEALLNDGPYGARVEDVSSVRMAATGSFAGFGVRAGDHRGD
jgi:acylphosphatase